MNPYTDTNLMEPAEGFAGEQEEVEQTEFLEGEAESGEENLAAEEAPSTDDPVRVYLREMGSVSLLTRQGEIDLAQRMERGKLRSHRILSRSPLVQQTVYSMYQDAKAGTLRFDGTFEVGAADEAAKDKKRADAMRRLSKAGRLYTTLIETQDQLASASHRHVHVRAKLHGKCARQVIAVSQAIREVPFTQTQWALFEKAFGDAAEELSRLEFAVQGKPANLRELKRTLSEREAACGGKASSLRRQWKIVCESEAEAGRAKP